MKKKNGKIKEQMLSVVDNSGKDSKEYELKKSCLEDISKYINGEFTLFEREKVISPFSEKFCIPNMALFPLSYSGKNFKNSVERTFVFRSTACS